MHKTLKKILMILIVPPLIAVFFFDNIKGYVRFKQYCAAHPQFVFNGMLETNVGWQSDLDKDTEYKGAVSSFIYFIPQIKFFRFREHSVYPQNILDARFIGANRILYPDYESIPYNPSADKPADDLSNFSFEPENSNEKTIYQHEQFGPHSIPDQIRLETMGYRVIDLRTKKIIVESSYVVYRIFDKEIYNYNAICGDTSKLWNELTNPINNQLFKK